MVDILNLALPYFGLIFIGFACGKAKGLPESGLAWMNFFLLYVSLPALLFGIMSKTPLWIEPASVAVLIGTLTSVITLTSVMWQMQTGRLVFPQNQWMKSDAWCPHPKSTRDKRRLKLGASD